MTKKRSPQSRTALIARVANIIEGVTRSGSSPIPKEWFTLDLTMPQLRALFVLLQEETLRMSSVSSILGISLSTTTGLMDRLIEKNLVERWTDPDDRRSVRCKLTADGQDLCERLLTERRTRWEDRLNPLSNEELKTVYNAVEILLEAAPKAANPADSNDLSLNTKADVQQEIGLKAN